jgi:hypothetical protein
VAHVQKGCGGHGNIFLCLYTPKEELAERFQASNECLKLGARRSTELAYNLPRKPEGRAEARLTFENEVSRRQRGWKSCPARW